MNPPAYQLVEMESYSDFVDRVNELIRDGYQPAGGVHAVVVDGKYFYLQAMYKAPTPMPLPMDPRS